MATKYQLVIDCVDPDRMVAFWSAALRYIAEPPPLGFDSWKSYWIDMGVPDSELVDVRVDSIVDPDGNAPRIWFQVVPEHKTIKNRFHMDVNASGGRTLSFETRRSNVEREADRLVALGAARLRTLYSEGLDHYAVAMTDPEGNEFDIN